MKITILAFESEAIYFLINFGIPQKSVKWGV